MKFTTLLTLSVGFFGLASLSGCADKQPSPVFKPSAAPTAARR